MRRGVYIATQHKQTKWKFTPNLVSMEIDDEVLLKSVHTMAPWFWVRVRGGGGGMLCTHGDFIDVIFGSGRA